MLHKEVAIVGFSFILCFAGASLSEGRGGGGRGGGNVLSIVFGNREQRLSFGAGQNSLEGVENLVKRRW